MLTKFEALFVSVMIAFGMLGIALLMMSCGALGGSIITDIFMLLFPITMGGMALFVIDRHIERQTEEEKDTCELVEEKRVDNKRIGF